MEDVWDSRDLPVLREVVAHLDDPATVGSRVTAEHLASEHLAGFNRDDVRRALRNLELGGYVEFPPRNSRKAVFKPGDEVVAFTGAALEAVGAWPTPEVALDRLIAALESVALNAPDDETKTGAAKFAAWLRGSANTVGLSVASAAITGQLPG